VLSEFRQRLHQYAYADPVRLSDLSGRCVASEGRNGCYGEQSFGAQIIAIMRAYNLYPDAFNSLTPGNPQMAAAVWRLMDRHPAQAQTYDPRQDPELSTLIAQEYYGDSAEVVLQILQMVTAWQLDHTNNSTTPWTYAVGVIGTVGITDGPAGFCSPDRGGGGMGTSPIKPLKSTYRYGKLDEYGRATEAEAVLVAPITKGSKSRADVPGLDTNYHDRTHLIPKELGGSGRRENIVPMYWNVNQNVMVEFEQQVAAAVNRGDIVRYKVTPQYRGSEAVPFAITIEAKGSTIDLHLVLAPIGDTMPLGVMRLQKNA
jgi:hypothetical protein